MMMMAKVTTQATMMNAKRRADRYFLERWSFTRTRLPKGNAVYTLRSNPFSVGAQVGDVLIISTTVTFF